MSEFPFNFIFTPKQPDEDLIREYAEILNIADLNFDALKLIACEMIEIEFKKGFENLIPLISRKIDKITIRVNLASQYSYAYAAYHPDLSNPENNFNQPSFTVNSKMLRESLYSYDLRIPSLSNIWTWEHEIIHWLNSSLKQLNEEIVFRQNKCSGSRFLNLVFKYRKEGVAGLFATLSGRNYITSMESARKEFLEEIERNFQQFLNVKYSINCLKENTLYEIGPWMILHVLSCPANRSRFEGIEEVLLNLQNEKPFDQLEQLILLEKALEIDNLNFIKYLTEPGIDGHPFITPEQMRLIRGKMGQIPNSREDIKFLENKKPEESGSIISIIEFYNWFGNKGYFLLLFETYILNT